MFQLVNDDDRSVSASNKMGIQIGFIIVLIATIFVYGQVHEFGLVNFDDGYYVGTHRLVNQGLSWAGFRYAFTSFQMANWHPLTWLSYMLDAQLWRNWYGGFHLTNLIFHLLSVVILFFWLKRMTGKPLAALFVAGFFSIHPQHVESVAWISERKDVLSVFFGLLSLWAYCKYSRSSKQSYKWFALLAFGMSLMSKSMLVTLPCLMLLLDIYPLQRLETHKKIELRQLWRLIWEKCWFWLLSVLSSCLAYYAQSSKGATTGNSVYRLPFRIANTGEAYFDYLGQFFVPLKLAVFYPQKSANSSTLIGWLMLAVVVSLSIGLLTFRHKVNGWFFLGWFWFFGTLVPVIGLVQIGAQARADRYSYFPKIGLLLILFYAGERLLTCCKPWLKRLAMGFTLLIWSAFLILCYKQVAIWKNDESLFSHAAKVTSRNRLAWSNWGIALASERRFHEAIPVLLKAVELAKESSELHYWLALAYEGDRQIPAAKEHILMAIEREPNLMKLRLFWLKLVMETEGLTKDTEETVRQLENEHKSDPYVLEMSVRVELARQDFQKAFEKLERLVALQPDMAHFRETYVSLAFQLGYWETALQSAEALRRNRTTNLDTLFILAKVLASKGRFQEALATLDEGLDIAPLHFEMLKCYEQWGANRIEKMRIERRLTYAQLANGSPLIEVFMADFQLRTGKVELAEGRIKKLKAMRIPQEEELRKVETRLALKRGQAKELFPSVHLFDKESLDSEWLFLLSQVAFEAGELQLSAEWLNRASFGQLPQAEFFLEEVRLQLAKGSKEVAQEIAEKATSYYLGADLDAKNALTLALSNLLAGEKR